MQQTAPTQPSPSFSDFAGLLASLTSAKPDAREESPPWSSPDLGEDVATLSYESALRAHARYRPPNRDLDRNPEPYMDRDARLPVTPDGSGIDADASAAINRLAAAAERMQPAATQGRELRSASVTIRLSHAECAQLHKRAAEAGMTLSAYMRSCTLEADTLRAQVKQALAELKAGSEGAREQGSKKPTRRNFFGWIQRLMRRGQ